MTAVSHFSSRDLDVLNLLFDLEAPPKTAAPTETVTPVTRNLRPEDIEEINSLEHEAIQLAEKGSLRKAEELLTRGITKYPTERGSLWNNRAQVKRLQGDIHEALDDLSHVIQLLTQTTSNAASTPEDMKVLSQAYIHRATIYMLRAQEMNGSTEEGDSEKLEELASRDFVMAGKLGSELGRAMGVRTNPYAKMCGAIVQTALKRELDAGI